jgi:hypothetical protein
MTAPARVRAVSGQRKAHQYHHICEANVKQQRRTRRSIMAATEDAAAAVLAYQEVRRPRTLGISATGCSGTAKTKLDASANSCHITTTKNKQITNHRLFKHCNDHKRNNYNSKRKHNNHNTDSIAVDALLRAASRQSCKWRRCCASHLPNRCIASRCVASAVPPATLLKVLTLAFAFRTIRVARIAWVRSNA